MHFCAYTHTNISFVETSGQNLHPYIISTLTSDILSQRGRGSPLTSPDQRYQELAEALDWAECLGLSKGLCNIMPTQCLIRVLLVNDTLHTDPSLLASVFPVRMPCFMSCSIGFRLQHTATCLKTFSVNRQFYFPR